MAFAGLGGDVRTYQPNITYSQFTPVRHKKSKNPEVSRVPYPGRHDRVFRDTDTIRNANSIAFVGGVPAYERYFLGSENDIRGYNSRSIGPVAPFDTYITAATSWLVDQFGRNGGPDRRLLSLPRSRDEIAPLGLLTGIDGANPAFFSRNFRFIGGDTQLLGNFEYRIPIFRPGDSRGLRGRG